MTALGLDHASALALRRKIDSYRKDVHAPIDELMDPLATREGLEFLGPGYDDFPVGEFHALESIRLRWVAPDWFEFLPNAAEPFRFVRSTGETVQPGRTKASSTCVR